MRKANKDDLKKAYQCEKDSRIRTRILAAYMVCVRKKNVGETATVLMHSTGQNNPLILTKNAAKHWPPCDIILHVLQFFWITCWNGRLSYAIGAQSRVFVQAGLIMLQGSL